MSDQKELCQHKNELNLQNNVILHIDLLINSKVHVQPRSILLVIKNKNILS